MLLGTPLFIGLIVGLSVFAFIMGIRVLFTSGENNDHFQNIMIGTAGPPPTLRDLEMQLSFRERVIKPIGATLLRRLGRLTPRSNFEALYRKLEMAGNPYGIGVGTFLGLRVFFALAFGVIFLLLLLLSSSSSLAIIVGIPFLFGIVGFILPNYWLLRKIAARQHEILKALPDALDMMTICVDAGLGLSGAMQRICENWDNALINEFRRVLSEVQIGRGRIEAFESMGKRTGVEEVNSFLTALTMAEKTGANIAQVLHIQAEQMRIARRQRAEKLAQEASIKMLFPLVFLIFPAMFAVILGPAIPQLLESFGGL